MTSTGKRGGKDAETSGLSRVKAQNSKNQPNPNRRNVWLLVLTTVLVIASIIVFMPPNEKINQGLDIQGGLSVVLTAKSTDGEPITSEDMESSRNIIENRVNALGATEATVQLQSNDQILVQIPGLTDTQEALNTIGKTGSLVFARLDTFTDDDVVEAIENGDYGDAQTITDDFGNVFPSEETTMLTVEEGTYTPLITGENIESVGVGRASETSQYYAVNLDLDSEGTQAFAEATADLVDSKGQIVIILDDEVQSAPAVQSEITTGEVSITGNYSLQEAQSLVTILESGSLPVSFEYTQSQSVGPTLGQDALAAAIIVALIGLLLVMLYLLFFYRGLGFITAAAIVVMAVLYLGILATLSLFKQFSLTMAGIAGIVLTIGMAADSSILTLERFREEIRMGRSVRAASITGVRHGIMTSIDADLVTLVSALVLFFLASASVKGFGMTLALGIFCDILMMLLFKAPIIRLLAPSSISKHPEFWGIKDSQEAVPYYRGEKELAPGEKLRGFFIKRDFAILSYRKVFFSIACVLIVAIIGIIGIKGLNFGIEFIGGTSIDFYNTGDVTTEELREALNAAGEDEPTIQTTMTSGQPGFLVRMTTTSAEDANSVASSVATSFGWDSLNYEVQTINPSWGASVIKSSLIAFIVSLLLIILYISIRFREYKMGICAVVALLHDFIIVFGIYALIGREVTPNTIAALLTILGYSLYDKVVVFHRINENMQAEGIKCTFLTMANHSVNEVLLRSLNTSITSLIPVIAMLFFGGETLKDFALAMTIGLICGCYSSIAIATPLYSLWKTREKRFAKLQKKYGPGIVRFTFNRLPGTTPAFAGAKGGLSAASSDTSASAEISGTESLAMSSTDFSTSARKDRGSIGQKAQFAATTQKAQPVKGASKSKKPKRHLK